MRELAASGSCSHLGRLNIYQMSKRPIPSHFITNLSDSRCKLDKTSIFRSPVRIVYSFYQIDVSRHLLSNRDISSTRRRRIAQQSKVTTRK